MKDLPLKLLGCFVICLVLAANPSNALQSCKDSPTTKVGTFLKWTDCVGTWSNNVVKITAEMKNGQANGFGTWDHARGDKYIGMFQNSLQHGPGIMYYTNGEVDEGTWKSGKFQYKHSTSYSRKPSTSSALKAEFKKTSLSARTKVQENLKKLGLYKSSIDGLYGQGTERALKAYNSKYFNGSDLAGVENVSSLLIAVISHKFVSSLSLAQGELCEKWYNGKIAGYNFWGKAPHAEIVYCIDKFGFNHRDLYKSTPINSAVSYDFVSLERVKYFLDRGADINVPSSTGHTPLIRAAASTSNASIIYLLVDSGARIKDEDFTGQTALNALAYNKHGLQKNELVRQVLSGLVLPPKINSPQQPRPASEESEPDFDPAGKPKKSTVIVEKTPSLETQKVASGTGFYVSEQGHIITNHHVIDGCQEIKVHSKGKVFDTLQIASDAQNDLALLKIEGEPAHVFALSLDGSFPLQDVIVAGFPFGDRVSSTLKFTKGIVSSVAGLGNNYSEIQIDAALQPGNSGGPIIDDYGNVVAVAVSKLDMKKILKDYGVIPENTNFGVKASVVRNLMQGNAVTFKAPNTDMVPKSKLSQFVTDGTVYLTCWMTTAQIQELKNRKVLFREFED